MAERDNRDIREIRDVKDNDVRDIRDRESLPGREIKETTVDNRGAFQGAYAAPVPQATYAVPLPQTTYTTPMSPDINATAAPIPGVHRRVSWGAIIAGVVAAIATQLLLNLLGAGIGSATINPAEGQQPGQGLALGAAIWFVLSNIVSLFVAGWVAGRLAGNPDKEDSILHGFVTWALASMALVYLLSTAVGGLLGGAASVLGQTASLAGRGAQAATPAVTNVISQATGMTPEQVQADAGDLARDSNFQSFVTGVIRNGQVTPQERESLVNLLMTRRNMSRPEANATIDRWQSQIEQGVQQTKQTTAQVASKAASGVSKGAFGAFFALLLGLLAAIAGSRVGTPRLVRRRDLGDTPRMAA